MSSALFAPATLVRPVTPRTRVQPLPSGGGVLLDLPVRWAAVAVAAGLTVLLAAGIAVTILVTGLGHDHLMGLAPVFDLNGERNLPTWFSSALLLSAAALLVAAACGSHRRVRGHWLQLAAVFLYLSLDESASLHEMTNAPLRAMLGASPLFYFPWVALGLTLAAGVAVSQRALLRQLPRSTRWLFVSAGAIYVLGAAGMELLAAPLYAASGKGTLAHGGLVIVEEMLEMIGVAIFLLALLDYVRTFQPPLVLSFDQRRAVPRPAFCLSPRRVGHALFVLVAGLAAASLAAQAVHYLTAAEIPAIVRLVNLSREGNIPTWYQSSALLALAAAAAVVAVAAFRSGNAFRMHWAVLAVGCVYLSADEAAAIHELSVKPLRAALGASGLLYYPWVIVGFTVVVVAAVASRSFVAALPARTRTTLLTAAAVFLTGALGVEALSGMFAEAQRTGEPAVRVDHDRRGDAGNGRGGPRDPGTARAHPRPRRDGRLWSAWRGPLNRERRFAVGRPSCPSAAPGRLDGGDVDLLHRHHRLEGTLGLAAAGRQCLGERARRDLPGEPPAVLAPAALTLLAAIADDRVPVAVRLFLRVRRDLKGKGLAVPELRAAVEAEAGDAHDGELHRQHIARIAARIVAGRLVHGGHVTVRKRGGVEARRFMRVLVEPEADGVLWRHVRVLLVLVPRTPRAQRQPRPVSPISSTNR